MPDPILEEIWKVREELLKKHGGLDGYFEYVQKLDRAKRLKAKKRSVLKKARTLTRKP